MPNLAKRQAFVWWSLTAILIAGIFAPYLMGPAVMEWGFAISFLCLVFGITFACLAFIYTRRARLVSRMLRGEGLLAHWTYTASEWRAYTQEAHAANRRDKKRLFYLVAAVCVITGIFLFILFPDEGWLFLFTMMGVGAGMGLAAWLAVWTRNRQNRRYRGEVYITEKGLYINRELHVWQGAGAALHEARYPAADSPGCLEIAYSVPGRYQRHIVTVRVPVPHGAEASAEKIAERLISGLNHTAGSQR